MFKEFGTWWGRQGIAMRVIVVNVAVFLLLHVVQVVMLFTGGNVMDVVAFLAMPSGGEALLRRAWTPVTYMFTHYDALHILFNMLWLYWFGEIFTITCTPRQLLALYVYGGLGGALLFFLAAMVSPAVGGVLIGASAAVIALVTASAVVNPDFPIGIFLIGQVKLKWLALVTLAIYIFGLFGSNAGGEVAHIGGALVGLWFGLAYRRGCDITRPFCRLADLIANLFKGGGRAGRKPRFSRFSKAGASTGATTPAAEAKAAEAEMDEILDKIRRSGYSALTTEEKRRLFSASRKATK